MSSVREVINAFELLFTSLRRREFRKSFRFDLWSERDLLPLVRTFLLGYFGPRAEPERVTLLPGKLTGYGRFDFMVYDVAVEFVVRRPGCPKTDVLPEKNADEVKKLLKHDGRGVLVLFDLSKTPLSTEELNRYRVLPSLGRGSHNKSAFSVAYFCLAAKPYRLNVRVS
ncbi:hypothetical protein JQX13_50185 [Archangium violaceum]|uniref:hypothetical protein n=1 Tax=Archangium violaceum TaxID=83451 RepID=UPI00193B0678|nr:hypothetical protein [Archangium violaceum]QRK08043.1 hypothetical protein JQX13_50185 [Archangium violaceum]